ncbi:MAG TPA: desulfoferrodoxin family protein [Candidatus Latescibacteria bacterium]|nr:desulfoferrodoxin family protein [Candidatus Latescibacterota bacterium]
MNGRLFKGILAMAALILLVMASPACKKEPAGEESQPAVQAEKEKPAQPVEEMEEAVYTKDDPGPWAGKEAAHLPQIAHEKTESGLMVTVTVNHEMNPEKPHYIMWIKLMDGEGNVLGQKEFVPTDPKAEAVFELSMVPSKLVAEEKCNVHGVWMNETEVGSE